MFGWPPSFFAVPTLLTRRETMVACVGASFRYNEPCWIRTSDPLLKRQVLYLLS